MAGTAAAAPATTAPKKTNPWAKAGITGVAVIAEMLCGGIFMENVKMEKQRTSQPYPKIMSSLASQGMKGIQAGFWPWGFILGMAKGSVLGGSRAFLLDGMIGSGMDKKKADVLSGFGAGACQGVFMSPILLARTRVNQSLVERAEEAVRTGKKMDTGLVAEMKHSMSILGGDIRANGIKTLTIGMPTMIAKRALDWGCRFVLIGAIKRNYQTMRGGEKLSSVETLACTFMGGATACAITMPLDRMMPIIQQAGGSGEAMLPFIKNKIQSEGLATLQRGFFMRATHTGYHTMFAIFAADKIYGLLAGDEK
jgi:hypothetical protein